MNTTRPLIAVLDDELQFGKALARLLKTHGFEVATFARGEELRGPMNSNVRSNPFECADYEGRRAMKYLDLPTDIMRLKLT